MEPLPCRVLRREAFDERLHVARAHANGARPESDQRNAVNAQQAKRLLATAKPEYSRGITERYQRFEFAFHRNRSLRMGWVAKRAFPYGYFDARITAKSP